MDIEELVWKPYSESLAGARARSSMLQVVSLRLIRTRHRPSHSSITVRTHMSTFCALSISVVTVFAGGVLQIMRVLHDSDRVVIAVEPGRDSSTNVWGDANVVETRGHLRFRAYTTHPGRYTDTLPVAGSFERRTVAERARLASFCKVECR